MTKPRKPLPRYTALERRPMVKRKRSTKETERIYGPPSRREWMTRRPCVGCGVVGYSENAHVCGNGGTGRKAGYETIAPLCHDRPGVVGCHGKYDRWEAPFDSAEVRSLIIAAAEHTARAWDAHGEDAA